MKLSIKQIMIWIFILRPIIDLFWGKKFILGMNLAGLVSIFLILILFIQISLDGFHVRLDSVSKMAFLYIIYSACITFVHGGSYSDYAEVLRFTGSFSYYYVLSRHLTEKELNKCFVGFTICTLIPIFYTYLQTVGILEYTYWDHFGVDIGRGSGGYRQPSVLTRFCVFGMTYSLLLLETTKKNTLKRNMIYVYIFLNLVAVFFSYHRTGYLMVAIVCLIWFFYKYRNRIEKYMFRIGLIGIVSVSVFFVLYTLNMFSIDLDQFKTLLSFRYLVHIEDNGRIYFLRGRSNIFYYVIDSLKQLPIHYTIFGNGVYYDRATGGNFQVVDMDFLRVIWNNGIVGFVIWICFLKNMKDSMVITRRGQRNNSIVWLGNIIFLEYILWGLIIEATTSPNFMMHIFLIAGYVKKHVKAKSNERVDAYIRTYKTNESMLKSSINSQYQI